MLGNTAGGIDKAAVLGALIDRMCRPLTPWEADPEVVARLEGRRRRCPAPAGEVSWRDLYEQARARERGGV